MPDNPRAKLEAAFSRLPVQPDEQWRVPGMVGALAGFAGKTDLKVPPKFREVGRARSQRELDKIVSLLESLTDHLGTLHQPAILALAERSLLAHELMSQLRRLADMVRSANVGKASPPRGRPKNLAAEAIANILASDYRTLTKKTPTVVVKWDTGKAQGPFFRLVTDVFDALEVKANAEVAARKVAQQRRKTPSKK